MVTDKTVARRPGRTRKALVVLAALLSLVVTAQPWGTTAASAAGTLELTGHGYGHGRGMGQWGAYGYATQYGWTHEQILARYYGNTTLGTQSNDAISVRLASQDGADLYITSSATFYVGGVSVGGGTAARIQALPDGTFRLTTSYGCGSAGVWSTIVSTSRTISSVADPGNDVSQMLSVCNQTGTKQYRGELWLARSSSGVQQTVNVVRMEDYLRGVLPRESPASWGDAAGGRGAAALRAQAVAARSYAYAENRGGVAKTCDTTACQVYGGAGTNFGRTEDGRTDAAVLATAGQVLRNSSGGIVRAEFSSSTGGYTAGGAFPAVPDEGDVASPYNTWSASLPLTQVASAFGVGQFVDFRVTRRNGLGADGGRALEVVVVGTAKTVTVTGDAARSALGLKSDWFSVANPPDDWAGPTVFRSSANTTGASYDRIAFGNPGDVLLSCDWDGNGLDSPGAFRAGVFSISTTADGGGPYTDFAFGNATDAPVCGDWDGDGRDSVGVFRDGWVYLRNSTSTGAPDAVLAFGRAGDVVLAGDWNGDGYDTLAVARGGQVWRTDSNVRPAHHAPVSFGVPGDQYVAGDWDGNGSATIAAVRRGVFYLMSSFATPGSYAAVSFGNGTDRALAGHWTSAPGDRVAVARRY